MTRIANILRSAPGRVMFQTQFGPYLLGNTLSLIGTWMQRIACSWLVWDWTGSAFWVGLLAACDLFPVLIIAPFAGVAADRWDRLRMNVIAQGISALNTLLLILALATGQLGLGAVLALTLVQGVLTAAIQPSRFAMVQQMVPRHDEGAAVGLNSASVNIARLLGPAVAGALILKGGILWVFALNAAATVIFIRVLLRLRLAARAPGPAPLPFLQQMTEGFRYIGQTPALRLMLFALLCGGIFVRSVMELMPVIAAQAFEEAVAGLALLTGAAALGAILSGISVGRHETRRLLQTAPLWWGLGGLAAVAVAQSTVAWVSTVAALLLGAAITRGLIVSQTFMQLNTPDALRGRALGVFGLCARGSPALGALGLGYAVDTLGLGPAVLLSSGLLIAMLALLILPIRRVAAQVGEDG